MGMMPPYDPFADRSLSWAIARVTSCEPARATWVSPALVRFEVEHTLRGTLPRVVTALFNAPREAAQSRFYVGRALGSNPTEAALTAAAAQYAALDATSIELPDVGARVIVWLGEYMAPSSHEPSPPMPPGMLPMLEPSLVPPEGAWTIPTLRLFAPTELRIRSRWIEHDAAAEREVRRRLGIA
jgi:hypothetical protein